MFSKEDIESTMVFSSFFMDLIALRFLKGLNNRMDLSTLVFYPSSVIRDVMTTKKSRQ